VFTRQTGSDLPSYTIEQNLGGLASLQACGCRVDELTLGIPRSGLVTFQAEWVGADEGSMTPNSPTFPSDEFLHYRGFDALLEGVSAGDIEEAEVTFANNLVTGLVGAGGNARVTRLPAASFTVTGRMVVSADQPNFELAYSAGETFELTLAVTGDLLQGVHRRKLAIALPRVQLTEAAVPLAPGRLAHEVEFLALLDPTQGMEASVTLISSVAAYG